MADAEMAANLTSHLALSAIAGSESTANPLWE
jgi:hypothetical protein